MKDEEILKKAFEKIREYVEEHSIEQDHIAKIFGVERSTVSKILSDSGGKQSLERVLQFSEAYSFSLYDAFKTVLEEMDVPCAETQKDEQVSTDEEYEKKSSEHLQRIIKMQCASYIGFFIHRKGEENEVNHIFIDTFKEVNSSAIPFSMHVQGRAEKSYHGHIVSPPNQNYLYLYLRQDVDDYDRGLMIFYYFSGDVVGGFMCTSGIMISTDRNTKNIHAQWVALVRIGDNKKPWPAALLKAPKKGTDFYERDKEAEKVNEADKKILESEWITKIDDVVKPHLLVQFPSATGEFIQFDKLDERHKTFHDDIYPQIKEMMDSIAAESEQKGDTMDDECQY